MEQSRAEWKEKIVMWYQENYRRLLIDMHIEDWNEEFLSQYDPKEFLRMFKKAKINAPMIYVQSHVGLCY